MKIRELMRSDVLTIDESAPAAHALTTMLWSGVRHLPVVRHGVLVGVISERDVLHGRNGTRYDDARPVRDLMSSPPLVAHPGNEVSEAAALMAVKQIGCLPVVEAQRMVGIVTTTDLLATLARAPVPSPPRSRTVSDVMTTDVVTVQRGSGLLDAAAEMIERGVRHLPVVDAEGRLVGMLSDRDVRRVLGDPFEALWVPSSARRARDLVVEQAMTASPRAVSPRAPLDAVRKLLIDTRFGAVPVLDDASRVVGIVSYIDVLRALGDGADMRP